MDFSPMMDRKYSWKKKFKLLIKPPCFFIDTKLDSMGSGDVLLASPRDLPIHRTNRWESSQEENDKKQNSQGREFSPRVK